MKEVLQLNQARPATTGRRERHAKRQFDEIVGRLEGTRRTEVAQLPPPNLFHLACPVDPSSNVSSLFLASHRRLAFRSASGGERHQYR